MLLKERMEMARQLYETNHEKRLIYNDLAKCVGVSGVSVGFWFSGRTSNLDSNCLFKAANFLVLILDG